MIFFVSLLLRGCGARRCTETGASDSARYTSEKNQRKHGHDANAHS